MNTQFFYDDPVIIATGPGNIEAFIKKELDVKFPLLSKPDEKELKKNPFSLVLTLQKSTRETGSRLYQLYQYDIPVYENGISLVYQNDDYGVVSATLQLDDSLLKTKPAKKASVPDRVNAELLHELLNVERNLLRLKVMKINPAKVAVKFTINQQTTVWYKYNSSKRQEHTHSKKSKKEDKHIIEGRMFNPLPELRLSDADKTLKDGKYYLASEVFFTTVLPWGNVNWKAIIHIETGSVLYIRVLADNLGGYIYEDDPSAKTGNNSILPSSPLAALNALRDPGSLASLSSLTPPINLNGQYVYLAELSLPTNIYPVSAGGNFDYNVNTQEFAGVNAYVHNDGTFRLVADMGFNMSQYFDGTTFPVPVDHFGFCGCVNACAPGNNLGTGSGGFHYGVVDANTTVGISLSKRIVWHEFGHAILWDNVHWPNLGFCHSVGDSLAAVLCDPRSIAPDRFVTFPWLTLVNPSIDRRHDRTVAGNWGWYGPNDDGGYGSEQIMASANFRIYQALGGDSENLCTREWAARYVAYLIFNAVGQLTPVTNSQTPEHWTQTMMTADTSTLAFEGYPGRTIHKVVRWAFEKQNAFNGTPPAVDLFINDGRLGEYQYNEDIFDNTDIWNRYAADGGNENQVPVPGVINYAYVIVRNRGTIQSSSFTVNGFKTITCCCGKPTSELCWPNDFIALKTSSLNAGYVVPGNYAVVGPFEWIPCSETDSLLFSASTKGDVSNIDYLRKGYSVSMEKLVAFDNNIGFRRSCAKKCC